MSSEVRLDKQLAMGDKPDCGSCPSLASTTGAKYDYNPKMPMMNDMERAHPGRNPKSPPSSRADVDHGHKWGK